MIGKKERGRKKEGERNREKERESRKHAISCCIVMLSLEKDLRL